MIFFKRANEIIESEKREGKEARKVKPFVNIHKNSRIKRLVRVRALKDDHPVKCITFGPDPTGRIVPWDPPTDELEDQGLNGSRKPLKPYGKTSDTHTHTSHRTLTMILHSSMRPLQPVLKKWHPSPSTFLSRIIHNLTNESNLASM